MLHTKFRENRPTGSGEEDFLRVFTIYGMVAILVFHFLVLESFHTKFSSEWPSSF